jgi:hypothetical protein
MLEPQNRGMSMKRCLLLLACMLPAVAGAADAAADKLLECMRANIPDVLRVQEFELNAVDRTGGERLLRGRVYAMRENELMRAMIKIKAPPDLNNAAYLVREGKERDDMFVFLPALNRVRRIMGGSADSPLFGTDLSYNDVKQVQNSFSGGSVRLEQPEAIEGRPVQVLALTPRAGTDTHYTLIRGWIDQKACVPLKIDFYEGANVRKRLSAPAAAIKQWGSNWYVSEARMDDLQAKTHTTIRITGFSKPDKLSERYFNSASFYTAE